MHNLKIRAATLNDLEDLEEFEQGVIEYERPFAPQLKPDPIRYYDIKDLIERNDAFLAVAEIEGRIIGSGYALIEKSKPYKASEHHAYLGFMYVAPRFRGKGINGKLIQYLIEWSKENQLSEIILDVYAENESAIKAYKKIGFQPDLLKMRINTEEKSS